MNRNVLKIVAISLSVLLIYNALGYFVVLSLQRAAIRHQKWSNLSAIPENRLTAFTFDIARPGKSLKIVNEHEIMVGGRLYDVARTSTANGRITYLCVHDSKEQNLLTKTRQLNKTMQNLPVNKTSKLIARQIIKIALAWQPPVQAAAEAVVLVRGFFLQVYQNPTPESAGQPPEDC